MRPIEPPSEKTFPHHEEYSAPQTARLAINRNFPHPLYGAAQHI
ncbi:Uncharacterised protein [Vibrio cholerae]|nr:Uncharacterised protein [Vibrio cholerae]